MSFVSFNSIPSPLVKTKKKREKKKEKTEATEPYPSVQKSNHYKVRSFMFESGLAVAGDRLSGSRRVIQEGSWPGGACRIFETICS